MVALSVAKTVALTTAAPLGSVTFPRSDPVFCAQAMLYVNTNPNVRKRTSPVENHFFIMHLRRIALNAISNAGEGCADYLGNVESM